MILIFGTGEGMAQLSEDEREAGMKKWYDWDEELTKKGIKVHGEPLEPKAMKIVGKGKKTSQGFYSPDKTYVIGGYYVIHASSMDDAVEISKGCPTFAQDGVVEVREVGTM